MFDQRRDADQTKIDNPSLFQFIMNIVFLYSVYSTRHGRSSPILETKLAKD